MTPRATPVYRDRHLIPISCDLKVSRFPSRGCPRTLRSFRESTTSYENRITSADDGHAREMKFSRTTLKGHYTFLVENEKTFFQFAALSTYISYVWFLLTGVELFMRFCNAKFPKHAKKLITGVASVVSIDLRSKETGNDETRIADETRGKRVTSRSNCERRYLACFLAPYRKRGGLKRSMDP